ncbi:hypothetical protein [Salinispora cortesiana]|uniref:hypothetical protein n=1 Tax=Salinispora cortesiana TaxID=1305843 RepID=UPI000425D48A|nr:hypothetical protein [Salinispora cortesiana]
MEPTIGEHLAQIRRRSTLTQEPCPPTETAYDYLGSVGQGNWAPPQRAGSRR